MEARPEADVHVWYCQGPKLKSEDLIARALANYRQWDGAAHRLHRSAAGKIHVLDRAGQSPFHVNVSRSGPMAICAVACNGPVGADIETLARTEMMAVHSHLLAVAEGCHAAGAQAGESLLSNWVRLEAAHKAAGVGLMEAPSPFADDPANPGWCLHQVNGAGWRSYCAALAGAYLVAVAVPAGQMPAEVRLLELAGPS